MRKSIHQNFLFNLSASLKVFWEESIHEIRYLFQFTRKFSIFFFACKNAVRLAKPFKMLGIEKEKEVFYREMSSLHTCLGYL